jgi:hypothetical protein
MSRIATEPFKARELRIVKKKIHLLNNRSLRPTRLFGSLFAISLRLAVGMFLPVCGISVLLPCMPGRSSLPPAIRRLQTVSQAALPWIPPQDDPIFLHGLEDENYHSPLFGNPALKRLSRVRARPLPLSRETFNALSGTFVKHNF